MTPLEAEGPPPLSTFPAVTRGLAFTSGCGHRQGDLLAK